MTETKDTYEVVRETTIAVPAAEVHGALVDFHEWLHWSPWEGLDPEQRRTYGGPESGIGSTYAWSGNRKVGQGRMEIIGDKPDEVVIALEFIKPFKSKNTTTFALDQTAESTQVTWTVVGPKTLATKMMSLFTSMDKLIGKDFEKGLAQLKAHLEA